MANRPRDITRSYDIDLRQLRHMLEVMNAGGLGRAAARLHISQPALTKSIRRLEAELDVSLFQRTSRGMVPTPYAEQLRGFATAASVGMIQSLEELKAMRAGTAGLVTIAAPPVLVGGVLPMALAQLGRKCPDILVRVLVHIDDLFAKLQSGECDLVLAMQPRIQAKFIGLKSRILLDDELVVVMRRGHALAAEQGYADPARLVGARWALPIAGNILRGRLDAIFEDADLELPKVAIECEAPELIMSVVERTDCLGWVPALACGPAVQSGDLACLRIKSSLVARRIGLFWREYNLSPSASALVDAIASCCEKGVDTIDDTQARLPT